ncbi:MAG: VWA domain-containing protein [Legionellaceae bacterium]|nr:VWA domain-containing protein [Legionellaceae bacterium]
MLADAHFLRPFWLFAFVPLLMIAFSLFKHKSAAKTWHKVCDPHLLPYLLKSHKKSMRLFPLLLLISSGSCMILALAGPTWSKLDVPTYQQIQPRVILLDLSEDMLQDDLSPSRLDRAKFKLHDLLMHQNAGQFGLIAYTSEAFVVSPLTEDGKTIDALLPSLNLNVMPIGGNNLESALKLSKTLFSSGGSKSGDILILTSQIPSSQAVDAALKISREGLRVSVIPILKNKSVNPFFSPLTKAGGGKVISLTNDESDIIKWLKLTDVKSSYQANDMTNIPLWRDEGRWFILLALLQLMPVFWRGWLQRVNT